MQVFGDYVIIEPFIPKKETLIVMPDGVKQRMVPMIGKIILLGDGKNVQESGLEVNDRILRNNFDHNSAIMLADRLLFKVYVPDGIELLLTKEEHKKLLKDDQKMRVEAKKLEQKQRSDSEKEQLRLKNDAKAEKLLVPNKQIVGVNGEPLATPAVVAQQQEQLNNHPAAKASA